MNFLPRGLSFFVALFLAGAAPAAYVQVTLPVDRLPETHDYQRALRLYLHTLGTNDLAVPVVPFTARSPASDDERYALWLLALQAPGVSEIRLPAESFTLAALESTNGLALPAEPAACQSLAWLASWNYPGNPYYNVRAVKLRALVLASVDLCMLDALQETDPRGAARSDFLGGNLIWIADTFRLCKDVLPPEARLAFETGLKKMVHRLVDWGPTGLMTDMDLFAPVGLWYAREALADPELSTLAETYARLLFTDPAFFNPAGYFVDNGCFDTSYNGISLYFGSWAALVSDWPFAREAVVKSLRLRAHLCFPNPGAGYSGPSAMASRTSGDPPRDQWQFPARLHADGMLDDSALLLCGIPDDAALAGAASNLVQALNRNLSAPLKTHPWAESHWSRRINYAADNAPSGHLARARARIQAQSLQLPYSGSQTFIRAFGEAFTIARFPAYAVAIHTGPVGKSFGHNNLPLGFGGGQLSVFWTPGTGVTLAGRRRGVQGGVLDSWEEWRSWPVHAVSGVTRSNTLVTSNRIRKPAVGSRLSETGAVVEVAGRLPCLDPAAHTETDSGLEYRRRFTADFSGVAIETTVSGAALCALSELHETLPFFLQETAVQTAAVLRVRSGGQWLDVAPGQRVAQVSAIRTHRFSGAVEVAFDRPRAVRFSPVWRDGYQTRAVACTALVDLLETAAGAAGTNRTVRYTIRPAAGP